MISMRHEVTETVNLQKQAKKPAYFILWYNYRIQMYLSLSMA